MNLQDFKELITLASNNLGAFLIVYFILSQMYPKLQFWRNKNNELATKEDFKLLFSKYDDLVRQIKDDKKAELNKNGLMLQQMLNISSNNAQIIEGLSNVIRELNSRFNELDKLVNRIDKAIKGLEKDIQFIGGKKRR